MNDLFAVNRTTHKQWKRRAELISDIADWVYVQLDPNTKSRKRGETAEEKLSKAHQYVYEHLAVGKMKHPLEDMDPLFTYARYDDLSMRWQLKHNMYPAFQDRVQAALWEFGDFDADEHEDVTLQEVTSGLSDEANALVAYVRTELIRHNPNEEDDWLDNQMTGLILRYKCMGGFSDNLHGSVPASWASTLSDYTECFASPFNHKFSSYYSLFEKDKVFGSKGSFFRMMIREDNVLPAGKYEMNPPWNNEMYMELQFILDNSLHRGDIQAIIVGPYWKDAAWCSTGFSGLIKKFPSYTQNSIHHVRSIEYVNDAKKFLFWQTTAYWFLTTQPIDVETLKLLKLVDDPQEKTRVVDDQQEETSEDRATPLQPARGEDRQDSWGPARGGQDSWGPARGGQNSWGPARGGQNSWGPARGGQDSWGPARGGRQGNWRQDNEDQDPDNPWQTTGGRRAAGGGRPYHSQQAREGRPSGRASQDRDWRRGN